MFYDRLDWCTKILTIFFLSVVTTIVPIEVFLRYCFGKSLYVTEDLTRYLMVWIVFLASSLAIRRDSHISIEILVGRFHGRTRSWFNLIAQLLLFTFLVFLIVEGIIALTFQMGQMVPALDIPIFWFYLAIPVGSFLMCLNLLPRIWESLKVISGKTKYVGISDIKSGSEQPGGFL